ncbi:deoxyribonuclease IV [Paenibacillus physcomitrellae]|uniref:Endonuclease 4 n=1 Tax=Paenibacillus physcomitrellae TaxID=1619311 RepID=A0ABQ1FQ69_9BACL|nr:deoxyribonuclease IV [Paenibacillus physcomitrellae]GGA24957.1 putative endonuclease 4 [Paenibacillus physcomitrellae]
MANKPLIRAGAHYSIRSGYAGAAKTAFAQGARAFQYFPKNPRSLGVKAWNAKDAELCRTFCEQHGLLSVAHTPYPSNLAVGREEEPDLFDTTVSSLRNDLEIAEACGSQGIVVHFGIYKKRNPLQGYKNVIQCINSILSGWQGEAKLLIENQAGNHGDMGMTLEELLQVRKLCEQPERVGFCLDTCHAFAAGIWGGSGEQSLITKGQELRFWELVDCVHLNDSVYPAGSRRDRHARVGRGFIGAGSLEELIKIRELEGKPLIMETEPGADLTYREDIGLVNGWAAI